MRTATRWLAASSAICLATGVAYGQEPREPGYLGIIVNESEDNAPGVRVREVVPGGPCDQAGIRAGDQITTADGREVGEIDDLRAVVEGSRVGTPIRFTLVRDGDSVQVEVAPSERPPPARRPFENFGRIEAAPGEPPAAAPADRTAPPPLLGVRTVAIGDEEQSRLRLPSRDGALVTSVVADSPAGKAGIPLDAVIFGVDRQPVGGPEELARVVRAAGAGATITIDFFHDARVQSRRVTLSGNADGGNDDGPVTEMLPQPGGTPRPASNDELRERMNQMERAMADMALRLESLEDLLRRVLEERDAEQPPASPEEAPATAP